MMFALWGNPIEDMFAVWVMAEAVARVGCEKLLLHVKKHRYFRLSHSITLLRQCFMAIL